jgi:hypothetical protein
MTSRAQEMTELPLFYHSPCAILAWHDYILTLFREITMGYPHEEQMGDDMIAGVSRRKFLLLLACAFISSGCSRFFFTGYNRSTT